MLGAGWTVGWLVVAVVVGILLSMWVTFTLTRLDRLHARVDAARASLDAQLVRRAAAVQQAVRSADATLTPAARETADAVSHAALGAAQAPTAGQRENAENAVGRVLAGLVGDGIVDGVAAAELREAAARVQVARRFYNDAVRDTRALRARRMPRLFRLAGRVPMPQFFDIDDTLPPEMPGPGPSSGSTGSGSDHSAEGNS